MVLNLRHLIKERNIANIGERADSLQDCRAINELLSAELILGTSYVRIAVTDSQPLKLTKSIAPTGATMNMQSGTE